MSDENDKLGTSDPQAGDAAEDTQTTGAEDSEGQGGLSAEDTEKLNLKWKTDAEEARKELARIKAENEALKTRSEPTPAATVPEGEDEAYWEEIKGYAAKGDPVAKAVLRQRDREDNLVREISHANQLRDMPAELRQKVYDHFQKNRHRLGDPNAARAEIRESDLASENERLRKELEKAKQVPDKDVVRTSVREVPASEHKVRQMTRDQWLREQGSLSDEERMAQQSARRNGRIQVKG